MTTGPSPNAQCQGGLPRATRRLLPWLAATLILAGLYATSRYSYLLFHTVSEVFSIVIGCGIFMVAWNARRLLENNYLLLLGTAFLSIAILDLAHTLAYKGMAIFPEAGSNLPTQLWIAARFTQALSLLIAPLALGRHIRPSLLVLAYSGLTLLLLLSIFVWQIFPTCYVEESGLTPFKRIAEYIICVILVASMICLLRRRADFDPQVLRLLLWSIGLTVAAELVFATYVSVYGTVNMLGHLLKIAASYLVYKAIIETGFARPQRLLLRQAIQSEERYRLLFDLCPDPIFSVDPSGRFLMVNRACESTSGYSASELAGKPFAELCAPDHLAKTVGAFQDNLTKREYGEFETVLIRKDGTRVELWVAGKPLVSEGKIVAVHCSAKDISERKRFQAELERLVQERTAKLQEMVTELEHFSYSITHDMRAPLRAMRGFAGLLQESSPGTLDLEAQQYLQRIMSSAERMDQLITDALQYSSTVTKPLAVARVDAGVLLREIIESYPNLQPPKVEIHIDSQIPAVLGNSAGLTQCFSNLLSNAVKFVEPGKMPRVRVWAETRTGESPGSPRIVRVWFEDNGIGIPKHAQKRLFQMFQRLSLNQEGTGIGLALVRKVAERMGGRVGVESQFGGGSRFWLEFKAAGQSDPPISPRP